MYGCFVLLVSYFLSFFSSFFFSSFFSSSFFFFFFFNQNAVFSLADGNKAGLEFLDCIIVGNSFRDNPLHWDIMLLL